MTLTGDRVNIGNDYFTWWTEYGTSGGNLATDADDDGVVNSADLAVWSANFGNTLSLLNFS